MHYRKLTPEFERIAASVNKLSHKDQRWVWGEAQKTAMLTIEKVMTMASVLAHYDPAKQLTSETDASGLGSWVVFFSPMERMTMF